MNIESAEEKLRGVLRHACATHSLNRGVNLKALQAAMGHSQIETTIGYCHSDALSVPSPLEAL